MGACACAHAVGFRNSFGGVLGIEGQGAEEFHSLSQDTDKKQSGAAMNPPSVQSLTLLCLFPPCLSLSYFSSPLCSL